MFKRLPEAGSGAGTVHLVVDGKSIEAREGDSVRIAGAECGRGLWGLRHPGPPPVDEAMLARHRVGMFDETFRITIDWALGLHIDTAHFGRHCSPRAAGHGGAQSSVAFCDPRHGLAVACVCSISSTQETRRI